MSSGIRLDFFSRMTYTNTFLSQIMNSKVTVVINADTFSTLVTENKNCREKLSPAGVKHVKHHARATNKRALLFVRNYINLQLCVFLTLTTMDDLTDNIFLRAAMAGEIQIPRTTSSARPGTSTFTSTMSSVESCTSKGKGRRKPNAANRKYSKLEDQLILKAVELKGRDWRAVLAFLQRN